MSVDWAYLDAGADAAEEVLRQVFGRRVQKDWTDPMTQDGYSKILRNLLRGILAVTAGPERQVIQAAMKQIDVDWPAMTLAQRTARIKAVEKVFGKLPNLIIPRVQAVLGKEGRTIITGTKESLSKKHRGIAASFTSVDQRVVDHARTSQAFFIRDQYGKRVESLSAKARQIVADGIEKGLDRYDIGADLASALQASVPRSQAYWNVVASIFATRSRTYGTLASFEDAGIEQHEWSSVLDEVTSDVCRFMDGKIFSTRSAVSRFVDVANSSDPEAVVQFQPFMQVGRDDEGNRGLYYKSDGARVPVARIERSGMGTKDDRGEFSGGMSRGKMEAAGISSPPAHGHCRSLLVAYFGNVQVPSNAPVPARGPAAPAAPKAPKPRAPHPAPPTAPIVPIAPPAAPAPVVVPPTPATPAVPPSLTQYALPKIGTHFDMFESKLPTATTNEVLSIIDKVGLLGFLEKKPLESLKLAKLKRNINGSYEWGARTKGRLLVHSERENSHGESLVPGKIWSVSKAGVSAVEAMQRTLVHELGHHVHIAYRIQVDMLIRKAFARSTSRITRYANWDHQEYFAESFAAYSFARDTLKNHDPNGFAMVESVRKMLGLLDE